MYLSAPECGLQVRNSLRVAVGLGGHIEDVIDDGGRLVGGPLERGPEALHLLRSCKQFGTSKLQHADIGIIR